MKRTARKAIALLVLGSLLAGPVLAPMRAHAGQEQPEVVEQVVGDLVGAGISIAATLSGSVPLAFAAGYVSKYITTYGIQGVKSLINFFKGYTPQDLGEINLYYVYLLHVKRNLYQTLINIRRTAENEESLAHIVAELDKVQQSISEECAADDGCKPQWFDDSMVNWQFLNLALDAKESLEVSAFLAEREIKNTYQYLMLLYMDVIIVEQKLLEAQQNAIANRVLDTLEVLEDNDYLSNEEKEFQGQMLLSMALRWRHMADTRRVIVARAIAKPLQALAEENAQLDDEIAAYKPKQRAGSSRGDSYEKYLQRLEKEMKEAGMHLDAYASDPFQTGTALKGYYLAEKTLLLERDAFLQLKANELETTEQVADYHHRTRVLRAHGNNILIQLIKALEQRNEEGFAHVEGPKHEAALEELIEGCKKDAACVAETLERPETSLHNILVDNFALASQVFEQIPYMHVLEMNSVYQLVQLIYLEVFYSQNVLAAKEFEIFIEKQKQIDKSIRRNDNLTSFEKDLHREMVRNTVNKWKKRILERKYDHKDEFRARASELLERNKDLFGRLEALRGENEDVFDGLDEKRSCFSWFNFRKWRWCRNTKKLARHLEAMAKGDPLFLDEKEAKLPKKFWKSL